MQKKTILGGLTWIDKKYSSVVEMRYWFAVTGKYHKLTEKTKFFLKMCTYTFAALSF